MSAFDLLYDVYDKNGEIVGREMDLGSIWFLYSFGDFQWKPSKKLELPETIIETPSKDELFMKMVYLNAAQSKDPKTRIGAVIVKGDNIISCGFNGFPRKVKDYKSRYEDRETKHKFVCHAEANSIFSAARNGISTSNTIIYTQGIPCNSCCQAIINCGVHTIVTHKQWPNLTYSPKWVESIEISKIMIEEAGIQLKELDKILGVKGFLDGKEIEV